MTPLPNEDEAVPEPSEMRPSRKLGLIGFRLPLPTFIGWALSFFFWVSTPQLLSCRCRGSRARPALRFACMLYFAADAEKLSAVLGLLLNIVSCVDLALTCSCPRHRSLRSFKLYVPFRISKETTYITEPLKADGYPNYVAVLNRQYSEGVSPDNNAAVLLWQAIGPNIGPT